MKSRIVAAGVALATAASLVLVGVAPAQAQSDSYTNPLATSDSTDLDITSFDASISNQVLTVVEHVENLAGPSITAGLYLQSQQAVTVTSGTAYGLGLISPDGSSVSNAYGILATGGAISFAPALVGYTLATDFSAGTVTITVPLESLPFSYATGLYLGATVQDSSGAPVTAAPSATTGPTDPSDAYGDIYGFGPLYGDAIPTATTLSLSAPVQTYGPAQVIANVTVTPTAAPGFVQVADGTTILGSSPVTRGVASVLIPANLATGAHLLTARFVPTNATVFKPSESAVVPFTVTSVANTTPTTTAAQTTKTTVKLSKKSQHFKKKATVKVTATVSGKPAGKIVFYDGKKKLKTVSLKKGKASYSLSRTLAKGTHKIKAVFVPKNAAAYRTSTAKIVKVKVVK